MEIRSRKYSKLKFENLIEFCQYQVLLSGDVQMVTAHVFKRQKVANPIFQLITWEMQPGLIFLCLC